MSLLKHIPTKIPPVDRELQRVYKEINKLIEAVNKPQQSLGRGAEGKSGDIRVVEGGDREPYIEVKGDKGWYSTFTGVVQEKPAFGRPYPHFKHLFVENLYADLFTIKQTLATNGDQLISDHAIVESVTNNTITFRDPTNLNLCPFAVNDKCEVKSIKADKSLAIKTIQFTVTAVNGRTVTVSYTSADKASVGDVVVRKGNSSDTSRQNVIYFSTNDTNSPYTDYYTGVTGFTFPAPSVRIGKLTGISDSDFGGALSGYGLYAENAYLKGQIYLSDNGAISLGKTAYNDTTNAGFWIGDSDATAGINPYFYLGTASDAKYIKANLKSGTFETLGIDIVSGAIKSTTSKTYGDGAAGYWLGKYGTNDYRFEIFNSGSKYFRYDNTDFELVGGTITGGTIQTATSGNRVEISSNQIIFYNDVGGSTPGYIQPDSTGDQIYFLMNAIRVGDAPGLSPALLGQQSLQMNLSGLGYMKLSVTAGLEFGAFNSLDTNLYRDAANILRTDDSFRCADLAIGTTTIVNSSRDISNIGTITAQKNQSAFSYIKMTNTNSGYGSGLYAVADGGGVILQALGSAEATTGWANHGRLRSDTGLDGLVIEAGGTGDEIYFAQNGTTLGYYNGTGHYILKELTTNPDMTSEAGTGTAFYMKGDKLIFSFKTGGTTKYWYLDLTSTSGTWTYTTTAP